MSRAQDGVAGHRDEPAIGAGAARGNGVLPRVLVSAPHESSRQGIANIFAAARPHFSDRIIFVPRGPRAREKRWQRWIRPFSDVVRFLVVLACRRIDLVHQNTSFGTRGLIRDGVTLLLALVARRPVLVFFHGWDEELEKSIRPLPLWLFKRVYFSAVGMIVHATSVEERLRAWGYEGEIFIETNIVPREMLRPLPIPTRAPGEPLVVLFLARVENDKGIYQAIEAIRLANASGGNVRLIVAGSGGELDNARAKVLSEGIAGVDFRGFVTGQAKRACLEESHVYLLPTFHFEGLPNTIMEAMASGLPVITRPMGGIANFFVDGRMGWCTSSADPRDYADYLLHLFADDKLRRRMGAFNLAYAEEHLVADRVVERLEAIYSKLVTA